MIRNVTESSVLPNSAMYGIWKCQASSADARIFMAYVLCLDATALGTDSCTCDVPCTRLIYDATTFSSLLDTKKLQANKYKVIAML